MKPLRALLLGVGLFLGSPLCAREAAFLPAADHADWTAIGRLNVIGHKRRGMCTATLITPDTVLSAAHCVVDGTGALIAPEKFRFVAGWFRGDYAAVGLVDTVQVSPGYLQGARTGRVSVGDDTAILTLSTPITELPPLPTAPPETTTPVRILGYRWDRPHALSDTGTCALRMMAGGVMRMTCPATFGNSGGPLLQETAKGWRVVGVVSAIDAAGTLAAPLPND